VLSLAYPMTEESQMLEASGKNKVSEKIKIINNEKTLILLELGVSF